MAGLYRRELMQMSKKQKQKKEKPSHSALANSVWSAGMLIKNSPAAFFIIVLMIPVNVGMQYLGIYLPALVVEEVTERQTVRHALVSVGGIMLALLIGNILRQALWHIKDAKFGVYRYKLSNMLTRKGLGMFYQEHEKKEVRDLAYRADTATWMRNGSMPLTDMIKNAFGIVENLLGYALFGTVISFASPWLLPLLTVTPLVHMVSVRLYNKWSYTNRKEISQIDQRLRFVGRLPDDFATAKDIRIYGMEEWLRQRFRDLSAQRAGWDRRDVRHRLGMSIPDLLLILIRDGGAYALLLAMFLKGGITVSQFVLFFAAISSFAEWVDGIVRCWNGLHSSSLIICDFRDYIDYPEKDGSGAALAEEHKNHAPEIVFDQVCFRYDGAEEDAVHNLSFTLRSGEKLALVGMNGAGKTTVVKLLCGLYRPSSGEIRLDGVPLTDFKCEDYYRLISPVFQDVSTAFFSLAETVSCTGLPGTDLERAERCVRMAGLGEKLDSLPDGILTKLDKHINQDATELSGGERQKLMLARALYKDVPILVLDEPTAALDPVAESRIYTEYNEMCRNKTSLFISHRLASTSFCDRILLLDHGQILEEGTHAGLLRQGGEYARLFGIQSCWYQEDLGGGAV